MHIVKRRGHKEKFDERKLYASVYAACVLTESMKEKECEKEANTVTKQVKKWMSSKKEVSSEDIFRIAAQSLRKHHKDAAFMYETHRDVS